MGSDNRQAIPVIIMLILVILFSAIGWLAYVFFDALGERPIQNEPFFAVITSGVQRASSSSPQSYDEVVLSPISNDADTSTTTPTMPTQMTTDTYPTPAVCLDYDTTITAREAFINPLEYQASVSPTRVRIAVILPSQAEGAQAP
jgi:hypothetical protein